MFESLSFTRAQEWLLAVLLAYLRGQQRHQNDEHGTSLAIACFTSHSFFT